MQTCSIPRKVFSTYRHALHCYQPRIACWVACLYYFGVNLNSPHGQIQLAHSDLYFIGTGFGFLDITTKITITWLLNVCECDFLCSVAKALTVLPRWSMCHIVNTFCHR